MIGFLFRPDLHSGRGYDRVMSRRRAALFLVNQAIPEAGPAPRKYVLSRVDRPPDLDVK